VLNDDNKGSKNTQFKGTHSKASDSHHDVSTIDGLDATPPPCDLTCRLMDDRLDLIA
jgi:hypothetical protein